MAERSRTTHPLERSFRRHQRLLWGLCYRMTGSPSDADDLVQETFARAIERPPADGAREIRPWLVRVAMNLSRDHLRRRRRRGYAGTWLPAPVELAADGLAPGAPGSAERPRDGEARYELLESASLAFLTALEALTPRQRAVLLLRDVFDHSARETAELLSMSEANVKVTLHRARKQMQSYDAHRRPPSPALAERARQSLERFVAALIAEDLERVKAVLAEDVVALSDGGGEFFAARVPVVGRERVAKLYASITAMRPSEGELELRMLNGMPALVIRFWGKVAPGQSPEVVIGCDIDEDGRIVRISTLLATAKVAHLRR